MKRIATALAALLCTLALAPPAQAERVKDLAQVAGVRGNPLIGYGLVVGLDGSGDRTSQTPFTVQSLRTMLDQLGVSIPPNVNPQLKNVAAVAVHAELPAFAKPGQPIDVTVSSIGNAGSLRGGSLLMTQLKGADGEVYAIAQGSLVVSGFGASGRDGSRISVNAPNGGRIPSGAIVERSVPSSNASDKVMLNLHEADFTTASRIVSAVNRSFGAGSARALDGVTIEIAPPPGDRISFLAALESLDVDPGTAAAKVIVNARSGTVVMGGQVSRCHRRIIGLGGDRHISAPERQDGVTRLMHQLNHTLKQLRDRQAHSVNSPRWVSRSRARYSAAKARPSVNCGFCTSVDSSRKFTVSTRMGSGSSPSRRDSYRSVASTTWIF